MAKISRKTGKEPVLLKGGPFHGKRIALSLGSTLVFKIRESVGYYAGNLWVREANWVSTDPTFKDLGAGI